MEIKDIVTLIEAVSKNNLTSLCWRRTERSSP